MHECQDEQSCSGDRYRCPTNFKALTKRCRHDFKALFATTPTARSACGYTEHVRRLLLSGSWSLVTRTKSRGVCNEREVSEWSDLTVLSKPWLISVKCSAEIQYCVLYCIVYGHRLADDDMMAARSVTHLASAPTGLWLNLPSQHNAVYWPFSSPAQCIY